MSVLYRVVGAAVMGVLGATASARADDAPGPLCSDRPSKSSNPCTVDVGHLQYEADIVNLSTLNEAGTRTDTWFVLNPTVKYGVAAFTDLELSIAPRQILRTRDPAGQWHTVSGVGDLYLRAKYELPATARSDVQVAVFPYLKVPTAPSGLGNRATEGGVTLPLYYKVNDWLALNMAPEADLLLDAAGSGRHLNTAQTINLGLSPSTAWTLCAELWVDWNFDPQGTQRQSSADFAASYGMTSSVQLDAGVNVGLQAGTPRVQAYLGITQRF